MNGSPVEDKPDGFEITGWLKWYAGDVFVDPGMVVDNVMDDNVCREYEIMESKECNNPVGKVTSLLGIVVLDRMRHVNN